MALLYRVAVFGEGRGPWRSRERQAKLDAVSQGLGEFDEDGVLWLDAVATIEWVRQDDLRQRA